MLPSSQSSTSDLAYLKYKVDSAVRALYQNDIQSATSYLLDIQQIVNNYQSPKVDWTNLSLGVKR